MQIRELSLELEIQTTWLNLYKINGDRTNYVGNCKNRWRPLLHLVSSKSNEKKVWYCNTAKTLRFMKTKVWYCNFAKTISAKLTDIVHFRFRQSGLILQWQTWGWKTYCVFNWWRSAIVTYFKAKIMIVYIFTCSQMMLKRVLLRSVLIPLPSLLIRYKSNGHLVK